ncbi:glycoside hydrolase family 6 protein [Actinacidiphila sp. ITFR-21]|uniref:glycoside hydrolase family 6 protein n=1 Tax=Actinacidiphila sp. ITFR-21 TaxID=3075199 RepID=UPI002889A13D|nr:glycoside hydrolase family 6 protein [Streptomyces sp. ITFR-21]WNI19377.1 glycoside hydrolase family 6 protein [Streptomyces sp. ITFR-21]
MTTRADGRTVVTRSRSRARSLCVAAAVALVAVAAAVPAHAHTPDHHGTRSARLFTPPADPAANTQILGLVQHGKLLDAARVRAMTRTPQAVWFTGGGTPADVEASVRETVTDAARQHALPVLALYNVPGRDCGQYSAGGAADTADYEAWIDAVKAGIGGRPADVILEPDSLALLPSDCGADDAQGSRTAERYSEIRYAVSTLQSAASGDKVYIDAGHSGWHSVNDIVPRLIGAGVDDASGFYLNISNYRSDDELAWYGKLVSSCLSYVQDGGDAASCPNQYWAPEDAQHWLDANVHAAPSAMKHFVTDTSRNGQGPWVPPTGVYSDPQDWCNPPGRGTGALPTLNTGDPLQDAGLWVKIPGQSDGQCTRGTAGPNDPERGYPDPAAGTWFPQQALELVHNANPRPRL